MITVDELLIDCQRHHSELQLDAFITVREGMTLYGCLRQALRELAARKSSLRSAKFERDKKLLKIDRLKARATPECLREAEFLLELIPDMDAEIEETEFELKRFYSQAVALREALKAQGVKFPLDRETKDRLDRDLWTNLLKGQAAVELMCDGRLSPNTARLFRALPRGMKSELACVLDARQRDSLINWFLNYETPMPALQAIEGELPSERLIEC